MDKKYSSGSQKRKLRKREDQLIANVPKLSSFFVPLVTVKGAVHKVRHARLGGGPRRCVRVGGGPRACDVTLFKKVFIHRPMKPKIESDV